MIPDSFLTGLELNPVQLYKLRDALKREQRLCEAVIKARIHPAVSARVIKAEDSTVMKDTVPAMVEKLRLEYSDFLMNNKQ